MLADLDAVDFGENMDILEERWNEIFERSKLNDVIGDAIVGALSSGDGAFKITADECSPYPIVEFYDAEDVEYVYILSLIHIYNSVPYLGMMASEGGQKVAIDRAVEIAKGGGIEW